MLERSLPLLALLGVSLFSSPALADPKPEALDAIKWGLDYCKDALKDDRDGPDAEALYAKFQARVKTATAADPSIRTWSGEIRGMKVSEWIPRCEKEVPAKIQNANATKAVNDAVRNALQACRFGRASQTVAGLDSSIQEFQQRKTTAIAVNKGTAFAHKVDGQDVSTLLATCDKELAEQRASLVKQIADTDTARAAANKKLADEQAARQKAKADALKKLRASLKGDRLKIYDRYGEPTNWDGDLDKTPEWRWHNTKTLGALEGDCLTIVKFKGPRKIAESESGVACKW